VRGRGREMKTTTMIQYERDSLRPTGFASAAAFLALIAFFALPAGALEGGGTDVPVLVLVDDGASHAVKRSNGVVQEALHEIRDQLTRYGYAVKTEEMIAATLDWDLSDRRDTTDLLRMAYSAMDSGHPEFKVRAVVIFSVLGMTKDRGFATELKLTLSGNVYDAVAQRHVSKFGPYTKSITGPAECGPLCVQDVGRPLANQVAAMAGDEARRELAELTKGMPLYASLMVPEAGSETSSIAGSDGVPGLITTYAIHFENFKTEEVLEVIDVMEAEFPEFVRGGELEGTPYRGTYGYDSRATGQKMYRWMIILVMDMGMDPDLDVIVIKDGTHITLRKLDVAGIPGASASASSRR
jgi:hypothetical protein